MSREQLSSTDRLFNGGPRAIRPLFRDTHGRSVYDSVDKLASKFGMQDDLRDRQKTLMGLGDRVDRLSDRQTWNEMERSKFEAKYVAMAEKQGDEIAQMGLTSKLHSQTLGRLFGHMRILEDVALRYRKPAVAVIVRRQLDDARYGLADGMLTAFSGLYNRELIMDRHDPLGKAVHWGSFTCALSTHFWRLHGQVTLVDRNQRPAYYELFQTESVFADCYARRLYMIGSLAHEPIAQHEHCLAAVACDNFETKLVRTFPGQVMTDSGYWTDVDFWEGPYTEEVFKIMLKFFVPALAWAYTELKKHIVRGDTVIEELEKHNEKQRYLRDHPAELIPVEEPKDSNSEMETRFAHGTALEVRKEEFWKTYVDELSATGLQQQNRGLYDYWDGAEDVYSSIEEEEDARELAERREAAKNATLHAGYVSPAFVSPANGIKHTSSTKMISMAGRKRSSSDVDGPQEGEFPVKAMKSSGSSSPPRRDPGYSAPSVNVTNAEKALIQGEKALEKARKRRRIHVARLTSIYKCLSILLDPELVDFAIIGDTLIRGALNTNVHPPLLGDEVENDSMERGFDLVNDYQGPLQEGMTEEHYRTQVTKLRDLLGKGDEDLRCFDNPDTTLQMEVALDNHLSEEARVSSSSESKNVEDIDLFLFYLGNVRPAELI